MQIYLKNIVWMFNECVIKQSKSTTQCHSISRENIMVSFAFNKRYMFLD